MNPKDFENMSLNQLIDAMGGIKMVQEVIELIQDNPRSQQDEEYLGYLKMIRDAYGNNKMFSEIMTLEKFKSLHTIIQKDILTEMQLDESSSGSEYKYLKQKESLIQTQEGDTMRRKKLDAKPLELNEETTFNKIPYKHYFTDRIHVWQKIKSIDIKPDNKKDFEIMFCIHVLDKSKTKYDIASWTDVISINSIIYLGPEKTYVNTFIEKWEPAKID